MATESNKNLGMPSELVALTLTEVSATTPAPPYVVPANSTRPFIMWDGEAVQDGADYCLLGCSTGDEICSPNLRTEECLSLILDVGAANRRAFHVAFAFDYDVNNILRELSWRHMAVLRAQGKVVWHGFTIKHIPHKSFTVSKNGVRVRIDDVFSYFRKRYDKALVQYDIGTEEEREAISEGKDDRPNFTWGDIEEIRTYYHLELKLGVELMNKIRRAINSAGFNIGTWHGPGALAGYALNQHNMAKHKQTYDPDAKEFNLAVRTSYAGGWFERFKIGVYKGPIYTADINSAYVYAMSLLPSLASGQWRHFYTPVWSDVSHMRMGLYHIRYGNGTPAERFAAYMATCRGYPGPLFLRGNHNEIAHPISLDGWYWKPEAELIVNQLGKHAEIIEAFVYEDDGTYPFEWVGDMYLERLALQAENNPAQLALKWAMASMYGRVAQRAGWNKKTKESPMWHQLEWAGWITSMCRSMVYTAALECAHNNGLVSIDTDGVISTTPFKHSLLTGVGNQLGRWKVEEFSELVYMQNGFYWLRGCDGEWKAPKTRGIPSTKIESPEIAIEALRGDGKIRLKRRNFVGYGAALQGRRNEWRTWVDTPYEIDANRAGSRHHIPKVCRACNEGKGLTECLHDLLPISPENIESKPHTLPWLEDDRSGDILELIKQPHMITEV